ncbi:MAG TPA: hypothetical protein VN876_10475, partial [Gemmatimonadaceae bacterium]|nr:hypothetical protein [Gemmatimonadaceae bacterium]
RQRGDNMIDDPEVIRRYEHDAHRPSGRLNAPRTIGQRRGQGAEAGRPLRQVSWVGNECIDVCCRRGD